MYSVVGRTKTTSIKTIDELKLAVVSCSNYEFGTGVYGDTILGRVHIPRTEIVSLEDYWFRYSQYRLDDDLQAAHEQHLFITIWDDHEIANDAYKNGAQNHQEVRSIVSKL